MRAWGKGTRLADPLVHSHPVAAAPGIVRICTGRSSVERTVRQSAAWRVTSVLGGFHSRHPFGRRSLSAQPADGTLVYIRDIKQGRELYIVGTAHVSKKSAEEVKEVMDRVRPDAVMVELCKTRAEKLKQGMDEKAVGNSIMNALTSLLGGHSIFESIMKSLYNMFRLWGIIPGLEFKVAMQEAEKRGIPVMYGDQKQEVIMEKLKQAFNLKDMLQRMASVPPERARQYESELRGMGIGTSAWTREGVEDMVEKLKNREGIRTMVKLQREMHPRLTQVMLDERDVYLGNSLDLCKGKVIVGVVGMAHLDGIEKYLRGKLEGGATEARRS